MKKLVFFYFLFGILVPAHSQSNINEHFVNEFKIIHKSVPRDIVSAFFVIKGGTAKYPKEDEGIESLAIKWALEGGTLNYPEKLMNQKLESLGTRFDVFVSNDYAFIEMACLKSNWTESLDLLSEILMTPALDKKQFKLAKSQLISDAKYFNQDSNSKLKNMSLTNIYKGMNYEKMPGGTTESLTNLTFGQVSQYYKDIINQKNCFLTVVGDIDGDSLEKQLIQRFKKLPLGVEAPTTPEYKFVSGQPQIIHRDLETNYLRGFMNAPRYDSEDGLPMIIGMEMLNQRVIDVVRVEAGLSYNPRAFYADGVINSPYSVLYISTSQPIEAIKLMVGALDDVRENGFTSNELASKTATFLTDFYLAQETTSSQCNEIAMNELRGGWNKSIMTPQKVSELDLNSINAAITKYTDVIRWNYLGNSEEVLESDFIQPKMIQSNANKK